MKKKTLTILPIYNIRYTEILFTIIITIPYVDILHNYAHIGMMWKYEVINYKMKFFKLLWIGAEVKT